METAETLGNQALELNQEVPTVLGEALENKKVEAFVQNVFRLEGNISFLEVLARIKEDDENTLSPGELGNGGFLDKATNKDKKELTKEIMRQVFLYLKNIESYSRFAINLASEDLEDESFLEFIEESVKTGLITEGEIRKKIIFEISESVDLEDNDILKNLRKLQQKTECFLALDDFSPTRDLEGAIDRLENNGIEIDIVKIVYDEWSNNEKGLLSFLQKVKDLGKLVVIEKINNEGIRKLQRGVWQNILVCIQTYENGNIPTSLVTKK